MTITAPNNPYANELIFIPAGQFTIGTASEQIQQLMKETPEALKWLNNGRFKREQPQHILDLPGYFIGKYPVTVGQYREFVQANGYDERLYWTESGWKWVHATSRQYPDYWEAPQWTEDDQLPVVGISWYEAYAYCQWLRFTGGQPYRLPTEPEWEKAARGTDVRIYPWGNTLAKDYCNIRTSNLGRTLPIGSYSPKGDSPYGCSEMVGNISEWTNSQYRKYPYSREDGREAPQGQALRTIRGASWFSRNLRARAAARGMNDPWFSDHDVGFRLAATAE